MAYFVAFAHWKVACIAEGVYARYRSGAMGRVEADMELMERHPVARTEACRRALDGHL